MNPVIIAAGIYLSARIISFIAGELTESEVTKQKEIDEEIDRIRSRYKEAQPSGTQDQLVQKSSNIIEKKKELCAYLKTEAQAREADNNKLFEEIKEIKRKVRATLKSDTVIHTPLRKTSLELLFRQLSEAQEKCYAYRQYLMAYADEVWRKTDDEPDVFFMQLPVNYPYKGKLIWLDSELLSSGYSVKYEIPDSFPVTLKITDLSLYEVTASSKFPVMITRVQRKEFSASLEKGAFKAYELPNTHLGLSATVAEINRQYIILTYQHNLALYLPKDNLIKPDRFPPIRSSLTVYPVNWEYDLEQFSLNGKTVYPVTVSERKENAGSSLSFDCFPICFDAKDYSIFRDYYEKNDLNNYNEEFLVGPISSDDVSLKKGSLLKLQLGDIPLFYIEVDEYDDRKDILRYYFKFHGMCNSDEKTFSADDIFLPFDVSFSPYYAGTSDEMIKQYMDIDDLDDVSALIWDLFEEFRIQNQIRRDRAGMGYFFKWESITNQLINVLEQGDSIPLSVKWLEAESWNSAYADILNPDELECFISSFAQKTDALIMREWRPQFFVKDEADNRFLATILDAGHRLRIVGKNAFAIFYNSSGMIELFAANRPYAEYQQKSALRQFRIGQVVNPVIQAACLNSKNIFSQLLNERDMVPFHNGNLEQNQSQKAAVESAFREKNIFLIQGPPGTGKTTVIRELVEQVFETDKESRVLIVSQANVAVDNALSGLIAKYSDQTVRCGNGNKISEQFQKLRLQSRCQDYLDELHLRKEKFEESFFNEWEELITNADSYDYSPVLCELIIRNHRLIGATCVGLAKRNIGLERTEFDLVIIDEAGKALPAEMLIPLVRARKAVIIGDQRQLPPVINPILYDEEKIELEERAISENDLFSHSFFERLYDNAPDSCKVMLDTQYRMPAVIGTAISKLFYEGKLKNGIGTESKRPVLFDSNFTFLNFEENKRYAERKDNYRQISNYVEAQAAVSLVLSIREKDPKCTIAVITPYKGQKRLISNTFAKRGIHYQINNINVDTIDSFQGSEADVVVFCTTRAVRPTLFFRDTRRINVALSRAKRELIILGRMGYFYKYKRNESCLPSLADYIKEYGSVIKADLCKEVNRNRLNQSTNLIQLSLDDISLPTSYYTDTYDYAAVQEKISEYYKNGDFINPLIVQKTHSGYILKIGFDQYRASQELNVEECLCRVISS